MPLEQITSNLSGKVRREKLQGKTYLVAPLSLIVPGVLNGSKGPLLYTKEDTEASTDLWNGIPIVNGHPTDSKGSPISARSPEVLNRSGLGFVFKAETDNKLVAEGWFDEEQTRNVDPRILSVLESGQEMELSTGLFTDDEAASPGATHNGKAYAAIARKYRPDHLAILPDQVGACSVNDGCGLNVNKLDKSTSNQKEGTDMSKLTDNQRKELVDSIVDNCDCWKAEDKEVLNTMDDRALTGIDSGIKAKIKAEEAEKKAKEAESVSNAATKGWSDATGVEHVWNSESSKWETKKVEEPVNNSKTTPAKMTDEEWFEAAPPAVQSVVRNAIDMEIREKSQLIEKLTDNISDESVKAQQKERLAKRSIQDLRDDLELVGNSSNKSHNPFTPNYAGASIPATNQLPIDVDEDDLLIAPVINWNDSNQTA